MCSNNYLGLANHPEVVEAGVEGLRKYGAGTASVRFICGTFDCHETIENTIARYMGTQSSYTFVSCWTANEAIYPTFAEPGDALISDELNHACIIDGIRLAAVIKKGVVKGVYKHNDLDDLRTKLEAARANPDVTGQIWVVTDGVFSMEGDIADLPALRKLCDEFDAMIVVDDSHGHGVMGTTGRGPTATTPAWARSTSSPARWARGWAAGRAGLLRAASAARNSSSSAAGPRCSATPCPARWRAARTPPSRSSCASRSA
jgi:glycine C-acetyltransferase